MKSAREVDTALLPFLDALAELLAAEEVRLAEVRHRALRSGGSPTPSTHGDEHEIQSITRRKK